MQHDNDYCMRANSCILSRFWRRYLGCCCCCCCGWGWREAEWRHWWSSWASSARQSGFNQVCLITSLSRSGAKYCDERVCLSVCVCNYTSWLWVALPFLPFYVILWLRRRRWRWRITYRNNRNINFTSSFSYIFSCIYFPDIKAYKSQQFARTFSIVSKLQLDDCLLRNTRAYSKCFPQ